MNGKYAMMNILQNDSTFNAIVGSGTSARIFYNEVDQTTELPFSIIKEDSIEPRDTKSGVSTLDDDFVYITHFSATEKQCGAMALAARNALDRITGTYNSVVVKGNQFQTQRSDTEELVNKKVITIEQLYKIMTQQ